MSVGWITSSSVCFPASAGTSVPLSRSPSPRPSHCVTWAWGSMSMSSVLAPRSASPAARFMAMVLLPHPPLALMTVMMFIDDAIACD